ncbi:MAG: asparagine synthase (glutamine-hydrolyzing) [Bacteroidota bacterium]
MCGITGCIAFTELGRRTIDLIDGSIAALNKRGPDANGKYIHDNIALGHARLCIIDTSDAAAQPFTDKSGRYTIVFNGEFFNFMDFRNEIISDGIELKSTSDTEILLYLFIKHGKSIIQKINGFFAIAIYDNFERKLTIVRDRYGIKPLYYFQDKDRLVFASEMKSLLAYNIDKEINDLALFQYFQLNYIPPHLSIFKNVCKIEEGSWLELDENFKITKGKYYSIGRFEDLKIERLEDEKIGRFEDLKINQFENDLNKVGTYEKAQKHLRKILTDAINIRMYSDVPLGAFLSGGIDSSIIVALATKVNSNLHTFSIGYKDEPLFDETNYAELVAKKYNTNHTSFKLSNDDLLGSLFEMLDYIDEPFADSSALAVFILSNQTKKHVTVALSGDGADEIFGGYNKHTAEIKIRQNNFLNKSLPSFEPLINILPQSRNSTFSNKIRQAKKYIEGLKMNEKERYWRWCGYNTISESLSYFKNFDLIETFYQDRQLYIENIDKRDFNSVLSTDIKLVLSGDMLVKVDRMSMANSLEVRNPFLDYRLIDFAFELPASYKNDGITSKKILKDAFREELPIEIFNRGKHGFEVPLLKWMRNELWSLINDDLLNEKFIEEQNIFNINTIRNLKKQLFSTNPGDVQAKIWALIVFQYWWKKYMR